MRKMKNKFAAMMLIFIFIALVPWIWLSNEYGLTNIPHYNIQMWIFMELYALICGLVFIGIVVIAYSDGEDEPPRRKRKKNGSSAAQKKTTKKTQKKPKKSSKKSNDGSYVDQPLPGKDEKVENGSGVEYPAIWDEKRFE